MKHRIVLAGRQREFENSSDKKRHYSATAASLRVQVCYVWHRHVVGEFEGIIPFQIMVHGPGAETPRIVLFRVFIDLFCSAQELDSFLKKAAIMSQIMDIQFESASSNLA